MRFATLADLQWADDNVHSEFPPGWLEECPDAVSRVMAVQSDLESITTGLAFHLTTWPAIQDATFFAALGITPLRKRDGQFLVVFRFSAFGGLFARAPGSVGRMPEGLLLPIHQAINAQGFIYVNETLCHQAYSGANPDYTGRTWWVRFFEYVGM
jgi:hypothetical protein